MNEAREVYLKTYNAIDQLDHLIQNCKIFMKSWKYWHAPFNHVLAMAVVVAYDTYLEVAEGKVNPAWKVENPLDFFTFCETLARQMLAYSPHHGKYLGDDKFRASTQYPKAKRSRSRSPVPPTIAAARGHITTTSAGVTEDSLNEEFYNGRLCGFLDELRDHWNHCDTMADSKKLTCVYCGLLTYQFCSKCEVAIHKAKGKDGDAPCFYYWHDTGCFGLAKEDFKTFPNKKLKNWTFPTDDDVRD